MSSHGRPGAQVKRYAVADGGVGLHRRRGLSTNGEDMCDLGHQKFPPNYAHRQHSAGAATQQTSARTTRPTGTTRSYSTGGSYACSCSNSGGEETSCFNCSTSKSGGGGGGGSAGGAIFRRSKSASTNGSVLQ